MWESAKSADSTAGSVRIILMCVSFVVPKIGELILFAKKMLISLYAKNYISQPLSARTRMKS